MTDRDDTDTRDHWFTLPAGGVLYGDGSGGATVWGVANHWPHGPERDAALAALEQVVRELARESVPAAEPRMCHMGHPFEPGIDADDPDHPSETWCNVCGENDPVPAAVGDLRERVWAALAEAAIPWLDDPEDPYTDIVTSLTDAVLAVLPRGSRPGAAKKADMLEGIVYDLANGQVPVDENGDCQLCGEYWAGTPESHDECCPWRRAVAATDPRGSRAEEE